MGAVEGGIEHIDVAGDLAAQRDPCRQGSPDEPASPERGEQRLVDAWRAGEQPDEHAVGAVELLHGGGARTARDVGDDGDGILGGLAPPLVEGGDDQLHAAVCRLHDLVGDRPGQLGDGVDDLVGADRQGRGVEDQPVEQVSDLVQLLGKEPPGDDQSSVGRGVLDALDEDPQRRPVELLDVIDDDRPLTEWFVEQRSELAAESERPFRSGTAQQPRLAEPGWRLDQGDRWRVGSSEPVHQGHSWQANVHRS